MRQARRINIPKPDEFFKRERRPHHQIKVPTHGKVGKPLLYDQYRFPQIAKALCQHYGFIAEQVAQVFGVSPRTIHDWVQKHPEFRTAMQEGRDNHDVVNVEAALLKRALGYEITEVKKTHIRVSAKDAEGNIVKVPATKVETTVKEVPPDPKSAIFWLVNRNRDRWKLEVNMNNKGKVEHTHKHSGVIAHADVGSLSKEQLLALREMISQVNGGQNVIDVSDNGESGEAEPLQLAHVLKEAGIEDADFSDFAEE